MNFRISRIRYSTANALAFLALSGAAWTTHLVLAQSPESSTAPQVAPLTAEFSQSIKPFLEKNCVKCHNADNPTAGIRVDHLDASLDDRHIRIWEGVRGRVKNGTMPPKGLPQPAAADREQVVAWITRGIEMARLRPAPKNGLVRRLTVAQYRNTLRELLQLDDDLTEALPPDAVSKDGFVNNQETLQLSPLLIEAYLEIAEDALTRAMVDPKSKPEIQNFRMDLGANINPHPLPEELILGANSELLKNPDFLVTQLIPTKPFAFDPIVMRTKYRFIEGYAGNDTVRGWRDYDSIYHAVFACVRGSRGYPKGHAYDAVPQGLLLRPAIPNDELFSADGTYGPKANFKISLRELPDNGRFRVTVTAAKYTDGLLLDEGDAAQPPGAGASIVISESKASVTIPKPGLYQVDVYTTPRYEERVTPDSSKLTEELGGAWSFGSDTDVKLESGAHFIDSPFGKAVSFSGDDDAAVIPRTDALNVGTGEFTVAAWIRPESTRRAGLVAMGAPDAVHGWLLEMPDDRGILRLETAGPENTTNGAVASRPGVLTAGVWQHVAAVVKRGRNKTRLYVNGYPVAEGTINRANLDNPKLDLRIGNLPSGRGLRGAVDEVHIYRRALGDAELQALIEPGRELAKPPRERPADVTLTLGDRQFTGAASQPAFLAVRLGAGPLAIQAGLTNFNLSGNQVLDRIAITPLAEGNAAARRFLAFERRSPRLGVHLGLRRDCGSTLFPVGPPQPVASTSPGRFVFEGAIRNYPSPNVEKDNVNYLAGVREIGVHSEYTDGRDMPRLAVKSVEFEGPFYETWPPPSHRGIFIESDRKSDPHAYARQIIRRFATRAYRRPITAQEEASIVSVFERSFAASGKFQPSVKDALEVVLTSPQFLFLIESSSTPKPEPLDSYELASKLSYFLWNGPPDRAALRLAANGLLAKQLDAEIDRMVAHPRFSRFTEQFASQWLSLDKFSVLEPDRKQFPNLTRDTRAQLRQEPIRFVQYLIQNNLPVRNLIESDFLIANEAVANYYGLAGKTESGFQFVPIHHGRGELGGVLTQAAIMAGLSDGRESNPVKRGAWLARKIIAEPPADPPPNVPALQEDTAGLTLRQRLEQHRSGAVCKQCHMKIDPWGVAFEEFDAGGRLKTKPADAHSKLPDQTEVSGANDLKRYLGEDRIDQVAFSVLKNLATYATGRSLTYNEVSYLKQDGLKLKASGYRMKDMVRFVVHSPVFLEK
ncbi:MAG: DUF1592 domain-containing protein [Acidobacteriota bacterium]